MKVNSITRMAFTTVLFLSIAVWSLSCKKDDGVDPRTQRINDLSVIWKVDKVANDNNDVTDQYTGFTLTIDGMEYMTRKGGNPWPAGGTYDFKENDLNVLLRSDGTEVTIDEISDKTLVLLFRFNSVNGGRTNGVTGDFTFSLIK